MDSNILAEFDLKYIPMTTIDVVRVSVGDNFWEALSIFQAEGNIRPSGDLPVGEMHIIFGGCLGFILDTDFRERGSGSW